MSSSYDKTLRVWSRDTFDCLTVLEVGARVSHFLYLGSYDEEQPRIASEATKKEPHEEDDYYISQENASIDAKPPKKSKPTYSKGKQQSSGKRGGASMRSEQEESKRKQKGTESDNRSGELSETSYPVLVIAKSVADSDSGSQTSQTTSKNDQGSILELWNLKSGEVIKTLSDKDRHTILGMCKTSDNKIVTVGTDRAINFYY